MVDMSPCQWGLDLGNGFSKLVTGNNGHLNHEGINLKEKNDYDYEGVSPQGVPTRHKHTSPHTLPYHTDNLVYYYHQ